ncbi:MAG: DUF1854 domain-containing protein [Limnochordia bacterium]
MYRAGQEMKLLEPWQLKMFKEPQRTEGLCVVIKGGDEGVSPATYCDVSVHRMFPLSRPENLIALCDKFGNEIGVVMDPKHLDEASREALFQELDMAYFIPKITRICEIKEEYGLVHWSVETDRGPRQFQVRSRQDIRPMGNNRFVVRDMDGNRYDIPDMNALDAASRELLEMEV